MANEQRRSAASGISVVSPTKGRVALVRRLLESVREAAGNVAVPVEILIVDDSNPGEAQEIERACTDARATYIRGPRNVGHKRNVGTAAAAHDVVLFIDSDCMATPELLKEHLYAHETADEDVIAIAGPTQFYGPSHISARLAERSMVYEAFESPRHFEEVLWGTTSNLSVRRPHFLELGGFHESPLTIVGGEDVDFGIRAHRLGYRMATVPEGVALHVRAAGWEIAGSARKLVRYGRADNWLCWEHPEFRVFYPNPVALAVIAGMAGAVLRLGRPRRIGLVTVPMFAIWARELRRRRTVRPKDATLDVVAIPLDWSYDAGVLLGAIQAGKPLEALTRFDYHPPNRFTSRQPHGHQR